MWLHLEMINTFAKTRSTAWIIDGICLNFRSPGRPNFCRSLEQKLQCAKSAFTATLNEQSISYETERMPNQQHFTDLSKDAEYGEVLCFCTADCIDFKVTGKIRYCLGVCEGVGGCWQKLLVRLRCRSLLVVANKNCCLIVITPSRKREIERKGMGMRKKRLRM
ncbi:hypothetical protein T4B_714 [Trichinella pseudospiralis]|uniref:Uncharacterized protein n=1 Tax=Trichinella pseudospiralis TaxID=6337 RepID=A0A0V1HNK6_TRIPS|nr:hypothetical protein T4B_714 [Trichinella pseudospiralis]